VLTSDAQRCRGILAPFFPRRGRTRNILSAYLEVRRKGNQAIPPSGQAYHRQYIGLTINSEQFIYGNFYPASAVSDFWKDKQAKLALVVCDGGPAFWGIVFRVSTKSFEEIRFNGLG